MNNRNNKIFVAVTGAAGLAAAWLHRQMMASLNSQWLLPRGSVHALWLLALTLGFTVYVFLFSRKIGEDGEFSQAFPPCNLRFALGIVGGALMLPAGFKEPAAAAAVSCVAGAAMIFGAVCRKLGKAPIPGFHVAVCLSYLVRLIRSFRGWSADPQLHDYVVQLLALVCLMLFAYYRASCDAGRVRRRITGVLGLMAVYFCLASLSASDPMFYFASGLWAMSAGPSLGELDKTGE